MYLEDVPRVSETLAEELLRQIRLRKHHNQQTPWFDAFLASKRALRAHGYVFVQVS